MSVQVGRLNFWKGTEDESKQVMQVVGKELRDRQIEVHNYDKGWIKDWWFGNLCLPGVPLNVAKEMAEKYDLEIDMVRNVIEEKDFDNIKVGDKVTVEVPSMLGTVKDKGTVIDKKENEITVRKYRSHNKGWRIRSGSEGSIVLGW